MFLHTVAYLASVHDRPCYRRELVFYLTTRKVDQKQIDLFTAGHSPLFLSLDQVQNKATDAFCNKDYIVEDCLLWGEKSYSPRIASIVSTETA